MELHPTQYVTFYLLDGFSLQAFSAALTALRLTNEDEANTRYAWRVASRSTSVISDCGIPVVADTTLHDERRDLEGDRRPSVVVIVGGHTAADEPGAASTWLRECRLRCIPIAAVAGSVFLVARAGLLRGRRCAVHWEHFPAFAEEFPEVRTNQTLIEIDGGIASCAGGDVAFDLLLEVIEPHVGPRTVDRVREKALANRPREVGEKQRLPLQTRFGVTRPELIKFVEQMESDIIEPPSLAQLVAASGLSRRQLERIFNQEFGRTPARYYLEVRLERADSLLRHSSLSVVEVSVACGFASASHFSKAYKERYGCTPQARKGSTAATRQHVSSPQVQQSLSPIQERKVVLR